MIALTVLTILTDERVIAISVTVITALVTIVGTGGWYFIKSILRRQDQTNLAISDFTSALLAKFNAADKAQAIHGEKIENLSTEQEEQKKKIYQFNKDITTHEVKIDNIERRFNIRRG